MTPEELAAIHPRLYHLTDPRALSGIEGHGLLPTRRLLALFAIPEPERLAIERQRRPERVSLYYPVHGEALITDNVPLSEAKLAACLDDGLTPADWLAMLSARVFVWPDPHRLETLLNARLNRDRDRLVLVFDTLALARAHGERMELSPINSGATLRRPARRGLSTFTPLLRHDYATWRRLRGKHDRIKEVTVVGGIDRVEGLLFDSYRVPARP